MEVLDTAIAAGVLQYIAGSLSASNGDLEWILRQGDIAHGMPSWSEPPEAHRRQLVACLKPIQYYGDTVFTLDGIRKFHGWTHASLALVLDHLSAIPAAGYTKDVPGFGFPTLRDQVIHIFNCEGLWVHALQGLPFRDRTADDCPAVSDARRLQQEFGRQTLAYLSGLSDRQLNADTELHFPDGDLAIRTPALIVHHFLTHAFHHKGQIAAMCRVLGHPLADTDLNRFK